MSPAADLGTVVVFVLIAAALALFVTERVPPDVTALGVLVSLALLEPWTGVTATDAIAGFANPATVTIMAMFMLSDGVGRTGAIKRLGVAIGRATGDDERRLLGATVGSTGLAAGLVNNTPVVAVFIPMITGLAERTGIAPSKLLIPLSYAAMLGGTLTLLGTATNLLVSAIAADLGVAGAPFGLFQFTPVGIVVFATGAAYLLLVAPRLLPERPAASVIESFELEAHLWRLGVRRNSPLVGQPLEEALSDYDGPVDVLQIVRDGEAEVASASNRPVERNDVLVVRAPRLALRQFMAKFRLRRERAGSVDAALLDRGDDGGDLVAAAVTRGSALARATVAETRLTDRFDTTVLAVRRGGQLLREGLGDLQLRHGDTLLLQTTETAIDYLVENGDLTVTQGSGDVHDALVEAAPPPELAPETPRAVGILAGVVVLAASGLVSVAIAALSGVVAMLATGVLSTTQAYDAVSWNVVFLLAGILPLGVALQRTGGAELLASLLVASAGVLPAVVVLGLFYLLTGLLANVVTPVASVVLMVPVAVDTAVRTGADPLPFAFAVMFAASTAFMTPMGYQTNLMVYGPGGYRFTDFVRVGAPLQLLLAVVTTISIAVAWPP